jgi:RimJ/RimL family protein N-acetyltransferase
MLSAHKIELRPWHLDDLPELMALKNDPVIQAQLMGTVKPNSLNKILNWLKARDKEPTTIFFVISNINEKRVIGYIQLSEIDKFNLFGFLGICIAKEFWGSGYAKESLELLLKYAHNTLNLRKVLLFVRDDNERAIAFYKKSGFSNVGIMKNHQLVEGVWVDVLMMERFMVQ